MFLTPRAWSGPAGRRPKFPPCALFALVLLLLLPGPLPAAAESPTKAVDFDAAMTSLRFKPDTVDANADASGKGNGLLDADDLAVVAAVLNGQAAGGPDRTRVEAAWRQAQASATADLAKLSRASPKA